MSATNDFLAFGGGASPNVIDQATYAALPARLSGFQSGVAQSAQLNKVWRQSSIMAAVLAQFIVARSGQAATDDGTTATLLTNLLASSAALNGDATETFSVATATASAHAVTLAQAQAMQGNMSGNLHIQSPGQLTVSQLSQNYIDYCGASGALILPAGSTIGPGKYCKFTNFGSGVLTIQVAGDGDFLYFGTHAVGAITLQLGDDIEIVGTGGNEIDAIGGSAVRQFFPLSIGPAAAPNHAVTMAQAAGVVGSMRNLSMIVTAPSSTATLTADEVIVETALGGGRYCVANIDKTINLATTGPGGMDTGSAPASGFVGIYVIYNPSTATAALLATNATNVTLPNVYSGDLPPGYIASALVSVWMTDSSGQFSIATQIDRDIAVLARGVLSMFSGSTSEITAISTDSFPKNAKKCKFYSSFKSNRSGTANATVYADARGTDGSTIGLTMAEAGGIAGSSEVLITTPQTIYFTFTQEGDSITWALNLERYTI
ncbi:hypothetical protein ACVCH0_20585 [Burkholderia glumae]